MKIITLLSQKGGSGKTTLTLCLADYADAKDKNVLVVDLDPQSSAAGWYQRRKQGIGETPVVMPAHAIQLPELLENARNNDADFVFLDTAPHSTDTAAKAVSVSDLVLIPCRPSMLDVTAIENSISIARYQSKTVTVVINAIHPNAPQQFNEVSNAITESFDVSVLPVFISQRSEFMHAMASGETPVGTAPGSRAYDEIKALFSHICI